MGYIAKVFVRMDDESLRRNVFDKLMAQREYWANDYHEEYDCLISDEEELSVWRWNKALARDYIHCNAYTPNGTEEEAVKLFLELAQMKGDSKYIGQWRKKGKEYFKLTKENIDSYWCINSEVVSPIRLAEAFKNKEVEL